MKAEEIKIGKTYLCDPADPDLPQFRIRVTHFLKGRIYGPEVSETGKIISQHRSRSLKRVLQQLD